MAPASFAGVASSVALLVLFLDGACAWHGSFEGRRVLSDGQGKGILAAWRRSLQDTPQPGAAPPANNSMVLAAALTRREDPLANLTMYTGGWNISDLHYWTSVAFTAVPLFLIATLWLFGFGVVLLIISCCCCFCRDRSSAYSPGCYFTSLVLLIVLTMATAAEFVLLHCSQDMFHGSAIGTIDYVVGQGNLTVDNLRNFSDCLAKAKVVGVDQTFLPADVQKKIDVVEEKLNSTANEFSKRALDNSNKLKKVVHHMHGDLVVVGAVMLGLAVLGLLFSVLGLRFLVSILVIVAWLLLTVTIVSSAVFLLLHNVVADACVAMEEWVTHPQAHTALDDILPCVDVSTANESMARSQEVTVQLVGLVNNVIVNVSNRDFPPVLKPLYFNQSGPPVPVLCNPFNADMTQRKCGPGEVDFAAAPGEWQRFVCQMTSAPPPGTEPVCVTPGRLTPAAYSQMTAAASISQGLYQYGPFLTQLTDCTFVRETFTAISKNNCPGLRRYSRDVYVGLVIVSGAVMMSVVLWMVHTRQRRRRSMC